VISRFSHFTRFAITITLYTPIWGRWKCETRKCGKGNFSFGCPVCRTDITFVLNLYWS